MLMRRLSKNQKRLDSSLKTPQENKRPSLSKSTKALFKNQVRSLKTFTSPPKKLLQKLLNKLIKRHMFNKLLSVNMLTSKHLTIRKWSTSPSLNKRNQMSSLKHKKFNNKNYLPLFKNYNNYKKMNLALSRNKMKKLQQRETLKRPNQKL